MHTMHQGPREVEGALNIRETGKISVTLWSAAEPLKKITPIRYGLVCSPKLIPKTDFSTQYFQKFFCERGG